MATPLNRSCSPRASRARWAAVRGPGGCGSTPPSPGSNKYQVMFRAPAGEGEPWKRVLRRATSEDEARKIFAQAEAALDTEQATPVGADVRASRTIRMLGEEYLKDSIERGKQPRTMEGRESRLNAHILPTIGDVPVTKWRVEHSRKVMEKGAKTLFSQRGREDLRGQLAAMRKLAWRLGWLDRSIDPLDGLEIGRANVLHGATAQYVDPRLRPETRQVKAMAAAADKLCGPGRDRPADDPASAVRHEDPRRRLRRPAPRRAERAARHRRLLRPGLRPRQRLMDHPTPSGWLPRPGEEPHAPRGAAAEVAHARRAPPPRRGAPRIARGRGAAARAQRPGGGTPAPRVPGDPGEGPRTSLGGTTPSHPRTSCGSSSTPSPACP